MSEMNCVIVYVDLMRSFMGTEHLSGEQIMKNEVSGACATDGREER